MQFQSSDDAASAMLYPLLSTTCVFHFFKVMALEMVEMVEMADGWVDFVIEDRDMQLLWDIYTDSHRRSESCESFEWIGEPIFRQPNRVFSLIFVDAGTVKLPIGFRKCCHFSRFSWLCLSKSKKR